MSLSKMHKSHTAHKAGMKTSNTKVHQIDSLTKSVVNFLDEHQQLIKQHLASGNNHESPVHQLAKLIVHLITNERLLKEKIKNSNDTLYTILHHAIGQVKKAKPAHKSTKAKAGSKAKTKAKTKAAPKAKTKTKAKTKAAPKTKAKTKAKTSSAAKKSSLTKKITKAKTKVKAAVSAKKKSLTKKVAKVKAKVKSTVAAKKKSLTKKVAKVKAKVKSKASATTKKSPLISKKNSKIKGHKAAKKTA